MPYQSLCVDMGDDEPFHQECRAFGRLKEVGREDIAVQVYGYILLPLTKDILHKLQTVMSRDDRWKCWHGEKRCWTTQDPLAVLAHDRAPDDGSWVLNGILKDWLGPDHPLSPDEELVASQHESDLFPRMLASVKALHRCGIVIGDVKTDQWVDGKLVDFSCALTVPYLYGPEASRLPEWAFASFAAWDLWCFQLRVIEFWNYACWAQIPKDKRIRPKCRLQAYRIQEGTKLIGGDARLERAWPKVDHLRPRRRPFGPFLPILNRECYQLDLIELPPYDPGKFDWRSAAAAGKKGLQRQPGQKLSTGADSQGRRAKKMNKRRVATKGV